MTTFADHINQIMSKAAPAAVQVDEPEYWCDCYSAKVSAPGDLCPRCTKEHTQGYQVLSLIGRAANGMGLDSGIRYHAVPFNESKAVCGQKPGNRSAGWSSYHGDDVTCPRCLARLAKTGAQIVTTDPRSAAERAQDADYADWQATNESNRPPQ